MSEVFILYDGYSKMDGDESMIANCTCTLIKGLQNIIVDTMTAWDSLKILSGRWCNVTKDVYATVLTKIKAAGTFCISLKPTDTRK